MKLQKLIDQFPKSYYCMRCERNCSKNPQEYKGKIYGSICITKIVKEENIQSLDEDDLW